MQMRGRVRPYALFKRYLSVGDYCYSFDKKGNITKHKVLEVIDYTSRCSSATWRTGAVYYFVEGIPNESSLGEEIYLTKTEAKNAYHSEVSREIKEWIKYKDMGGIRFG